MSWIKWGEPRMRGIRWYIEPPLDLLGPTNQALLAQQASEEKCKKLVKLVERAINWAEWSWPSYRTVSYINHMDDAFASALRRCLEALK